MMSRRHAEVEELLGVFSLDAVDGHEHEWIEGHLRICASCRREVDQHREVAALLVTSHATPPGGVWERIEGGLYEPPPPLALGPVPRSLRRKRPSLLALTLAAAAAMVIGVVGVRDVMQERRLERIQASLLDELPHRAALAALGNPQARIVELRGTDPAAKARVAVLPGGQGYAVIEGLPPLPPGQTYQLWAFIEGQRISGGTLGTQPLVAAFHITGAVGGFAITEETAGGVVTSTNQPVVIGFFREA